MSVSIVSLPKQSSNALLSLVILKDFLRLKSLNSWYVAKNTIKGIPRFIQLLKYGECESKSIKGPSIINVDSFFEPLPPLLSSLVTIMDAMLSRYIHTKIPLKKKNAKLSVKIRLNQNMTFGIEKKIELLIAVNETA